MDRAAILPRYPWAWGLCLAACLVQPAVAEAGECTVSGLDGTPAEVASGDTVLALEAGASLPADAIVRTGPEARAEVTCGTVVVTIGASSEIDLATLIAAETGDGVLLRLFRGIVGIDAPQPGFASLEVETDLAIASVRGTAWLVEAREDGGTGVFVRRGEVEVRASVSSVLLGEGEGVDVLPADGLQPARDWGAARVAAAGEALGFGWNAR